MVEVVPNRTFKQIPFQPEECRRGEQVIEHDHASLVFLEVPRDRFAVWPVAYGPARNLRCTANVYRGIVALAEHVQLSGGEFCRFLREVFRHLCVISCERLEALTVAIARGQKTKLFGVMQEFA